MKYYPRRIEITTIGDTKRVFLEPHYIETSPGGRLDPGIAWAIRNPEQAEVYYQQRTTWWERLVATMRSAW